MADEKQQTEWSAHYDEEGRLYYYNQVSGESSWEPPAEGFVPAQAPTTETSDWAKYQDDDGNEYYYNAATGETQWEKPEGFIEESQQQQEGATEEKVKGEDVAEETGVVSPTREPSPLTNEGEQIMEETDADQPQEAIDPAELRAQEAERALNQPDSVLEPDVLANVTEVVSHQGGNPQNAVAALVDNYHGQAAVCGLLAKWLRDLLMPSGENDDNTIRNTVQDVIYRIAKERFTKQAGDAILNLSRADAAFLEEMIDSTRWRKLLIDLSATHKDSAVLMYCLSAISKRGHHREIAKRVNQSEHFSVFNAMLLSELAVIGRMTVSAGGEMSVSNLDELLHDLRRACSATSYTYLYSVEMLKMLQTMASDVTDPSPRFQRAVRKWQALSQSLESALVDPSSSMAGSTPLFRKRRLEVALTVTELSRKRSRTPNGDSTGNLDSALLNFLKRHSVGIQLDDAIVDKMLPSGLDLSVGEKVGKLLIEHPLAIQALLGHIYKPGSSRVSSPVLRNKCAKLVAFGTIMAEKIALEEIQENGGTYEGELNDEVVLSRVVLQGSLLCEQLESMVSFLVTGDASKTGQVSSPGQKLCSLAKSYAPVAQGVIMWAREFTSGPEFAASASFPTLSVSILSLVRQICVENPFTRRNSLDIALVFLRHSNSDISYQKVNAIKEQSLRLLLFLLVQGEVVQVLSCVAHRLQQSGSSDLDASLIRYFVAGILEVVKPPVSLIFARSIGALLKTPRCMDAVTSSYFGDGNKLKLHTLLKTFSDLKVVGRFSALSNEDRALFSSLIEAYQVT